MRLHYLFAAMLVLCALGAARPDVAAQQAEKDAPAVNEVAEADIKAADELRLSIGQEQQALYNGLRYLLRPAYEVELMRGRAFTPCTLAPFEDKSVEPLGLLDCLRLWAILQSGMPVTPAVDRQVQRLLDTPAPLAGNLLAPHAVQLMACRAALSRKEVGRAPELKKKAQLLLMGAEASVDAAGEKSTHILPNMVKHEWFANHLWRACMGRAALELELKTDSHLWESDLLALCLRRHETAGWNCIGREYRNVGYDMHPNLLALSAISLAAGAPVGTFAKATAKEIEKVLKAAPAILLRLEQSYSSEFWSGSRLFALNTLPLEMCPDGSQAADWRGTHTRQALAQIELSGCCRPLHQMTGGLGLDTTDWKRGEFHAAETALSCLALCGGAFGATFPLQGVGLAQVGRMMHALSVLQAARARRDGGFPFRVKVAIEDGVKLLARVQKDDGSFGGRTGGYLGGTAYTLLAMMHGGVSRDEMSIKKGMLWMERRVQDGYYQNYDAGIALMAFQKYYEFEQLNSGLLSVEDAKEFEAARARVWALVTPGHQETIKKLVKFIDAAHVGGDKGGFGYGGTRGGGDSHCDNSNSQYSVLGYKAASLLGAELDTAVFSREAQRLIDQYTEDARLEPVDYIHGADDREGDDAERKKRKSRATGAKQTIRPGGWSYSCSKGYACSMQMTAAGVSSLFICLDELKLRGKLKQKMAENIGLHIRGAEGWLRHNYYTAETVGKDQRNDWAGTHDGWGFYYNIYAVERGCVLAGIAKFEGEVDWYRIGADFLLDEQNADGSWGRAPRQIAGRDNDELQLVNTCMAILFLKMAAMPVITEHKKREKERLEREAGQNGDPKNPVTGK